jgi:hypothetical protein
VLHVTELSLLKAVSAKQRSITGNGESRHMAENCLCGSKNQTIFHIEINSEYND